MSDEFEAEATALEAKPENAETEPDAVDPPKVMPAAEAAEARTSGGLDGPSLRSVIDVPLRITVEIGTAKMLVRDVLQLNKGSVVPLDRSSGDPADILVNGRLIARGEVTLLDESLAVRIVELVGRE